MKNIQAQYQDLLEGKMSKANFMRNVRMQFPQHISPVTSYDDSVKILKGKRILSEAKIEELKPSTKQSAFDKAKFQAQNAYQIDDKGKLEKDPLLKQDRNRKAALFSSHIDPEVVRKVDAIMSGGGTSPVKAVLNKNADDKNNLEVVLTVLDKNTNGVLAVFRIGKNNYKVERGEVTGDIGKKVMNVIKYVQDNELKDSEPLKEAYKDSTNNELASYIGTLKNELNAEKDPKKKKLIQKDLEDVKAELESRKKAKKEGLSEAKQPEGVYGHNPNAETDLYRGIDHLNYYQVYKGIQYELAKMPEISDANYIKARKKVVDRIMKDPDAYKDLQLANFKAVKDMDKDLEMKDVKPNNLVDKPNEMKVMKKDVKGNTEDSLGKKEAKKAKNGKGLQHMTQSPKGGLKAFETPGKEKVMALKEHILDELTKPNEMREDINKGSRVKKKGLKDYDAAQVGNVIEFDGDTAIVIWDKDSDAYEKAKQKWNTSGEGEDPDVTFGHHVQGNVLTKKDIPQHPKAREKFAQIPDGPSIKEKEESKESKLKGLKEKLMKTVKEMIFKKGDQMATASTTQSQSALRGLGYTPVPNTKDVKSL